MSELNMKNIDQQLETIANDVMSNISTHLANIEPGMDTVKRYSKKAEQRIINRDLLHLRTRLYY